MEVILRRYHDDKRFPLLAFVTLKKWPWSPIFEHVITGIEMDVMQIVGAEIP